MELLHDGNLGRETHNLVEVTRPKLWGQMSQRPEMRNLEVGGSKGQMIAIWAEFPPCGTTIF